MKKPTVFCSHCGAQLQTIKPGRRRAPNNTQAVGALSGEQLPGLVQEPAAPPEPSLGGFVEEFEAPAVEHAAGPIQPVSSAHDNDPFSAPYSSAPSSPYGSAPASRGGRPPMRRKKDNGMMIVMIIVGVFVVAVGVTVAVLLMSGDEKKEKVKQEQPIPDVGELFPEKKGK